MMRVPHVCDLMAHHRRNRLLVLYVVRLRIVQQVLGPPDNQALDDRRWGNMSGVELEGNVKRTYPILHATQVKVARLPWAYL